MAFVIDLNKPAASTFSGGSIAANLVTGSPLLTQRTNTASSSTIPVIKTHILGGNIF